ncbi:hypothetical protein LCGC14_1898750 [marine sediment metagenome]|uniref:Tyr recombinase domain-containing protein n=1 Tax=marine sediment metagenome TaxID=412755 RepID=A0A0F9IVA3_9ZZZZ
MGWRKKWHWGERELTPARWEAVRDAYRVHSLATGKSPETLSTYLRHIEAFRSWCDERHERFLHTSKTTAETHIAEMLTSDYARSTVNTRVSALKSFYRWALAEGMRKGDPCRDIRMHKEAVVPRQPLTARECRCLIDACDTLFERVVVLTFLITGIRRAELLRLQVEDVDWRTGQMLIHGKGLRQRHVMPGFDLLKLLREYATGRSQGSLFLWPGTRRAVSRSSLGRLLHDIERRAGTGNVFPHRFRHTALCGLLADGTDLLSVSVIAGHESLDTTRLYLKTVEEARALRQQRRYGDGLMQRLVG